jgi:hypothetical protein
MILLRKSRIWSFFVRFLVKENGYSPRKRTKTATNRTFPRYEHLSPTGSATMEAR